MLAQKYNLKTLTDAIVSKYNFRLFPNVSERTEWENIPQSLREEVIKKGEKYLGFDWPLLPAVKYMDYSRNGNRKNYQDLYYTRRYALGCLIVAECMEAKGRFIDEVINGIWCICEESSWVIPAHCNSCSNNPQKVSAVLPDNNNHLIDLFAAETGALLSWAYYLLKPALDKVNPIVCSRIQCEIKFRILKPYMERNDFWWMGFVEAITNNWNPWCNSNCLTAFLLLEEDTHVRAQAVEKCMRSLDKFVLTYPQDGGCDEGTSYWRQAGGSLFECLELLYIASEGKINFYNEELIKNIGRFIYHMHISKGYCINFADGSPLPDLQGILVYQYGCRIEDKKLEDIGLYLYHFYDKKMPELGWYPMLRVLSTVFNYKKLCSMTAQPPLVRDSWLEGIQVMASREVEGSDRGLYLAAKGGHNDESHNHNDIGQFIIYSDGYPAIVDVGVETYTAKTFSPQRYEIWTMQSQYHNLPTVNGVQQQYGNCFRATNVNYSCDDLYTELSMEIGTAYPSEANIERWKRTFKFNRKDGAVIDIEDSFVLKNYSNDIMTSLITPCNHDISLPGQIILDMQKGNNIKIQYDANLLDVSSEYIDISDEMLKAVWGDHLFRIDLKSRNDVKEASWVIRVTQV